MSNQQGNPLFGTWETCPRCHGERGYDRTFPVLDPCHMTWTEATVWVDCDNHDCVNGKVWVRYEPDLVFDGSNDEDVVDYLLKKGIVVWEGCI